MRNDFYTGYAINNSSAFLAHYGILGMKWGIRRYQNEDGSYTDAGKRRYGMNLNLEDTSRSNIAKIRTGEAKRRYDVAIENAKHTNNYSRVAETKSRLNAAKRNERNVRAVDRGAKRVAKGETIGGNNLKVIAVTGANYFASRGMKRFMRNRLSSLASQGRLTPQHLAVGAGIVTATVLATNMASIGYTAKKSYDNANIRSYYTARATGDSAIKRVGSQEYKDVLERNKKKKRR